jgi:LuxR family maltose regulon positive regulatory protein
MNYQNFPLKYELCREAISSLYRTVYPLVLLSYVLLFNALQKQKRFLIFLEKHISVFAIFSPEILTSLQNCLLDFLEKFTSISYRSLCISSNLTPSHRADELASFDIILNGKIQISCKRATEHFLQADKVTMNTSLRIENQLLATKFYVPIAAGPLIPRPRLTALLGKSPKCPFTLVSAAAGFGKTTLLASWSQSLPPNSPRVAWVSLDEENNDPRLFWAYILTALNKQLPKHFTSLLTLLQSPQSPPLGTLLAELINLLAEGTDDFVLILDDYHLITEQQVHRTLAYLVEHLPPQLRIIVATRADPPLPLALLRARYLVLEVRTDQLRCTSEETRAFLDEVMNIHLPDETIQEITKRTEGWLVGLQLLGLSLPDWTNPEKLLKEMSGDQRYILDYLTEVVLRQQPQEMQTFLLSTCILEQLNASLCHAVMQQSGSQWMLERLEQANLFVVSLDNKRQWYRYHALFAEALRNHLEQMHADFVPILHSRASRWYAEHDQITQAILHAFHAQEWQWAADLIERVPLMSFTWGAGEDELVLLRRWLEQLPPEIVHSRPRLCLACTQLLWAVAPFPTLQTWLDTAETTLNTSLAQEHTSPSPMVLDPKVRLEQENLLGEVIGFRAFLLSTLMDGRAVLALCQQALGLLSAENLIGRAQVLISQLVVCYVSFVNDLETAINSGLQAGQLARASSKTILAISFMGTTTGYLIVLVQVGASTFRVE